jgi:hypothetical protein
MIQEIYVLEDIFANIKELQEAAPAKENFKKEMDVCEKYILRALKIAYKMRLKELNNKNEKTEDAEDNEEPENLSTKS